jgi:two-component system chemotaxis sensor kinase CheA
MVAAGLGVMEACLAAGLDPLGRLEQLAAFNAKIGFTPGQDLCALAKASAEEPNDVPPEILHSFQSSSVLRVDNLSRCLMHLEETPEDEGVADELLRDAHTLKGDARLVGLMDLGFLIHRFEDLLLEARKGRFQSRAQVDLGLTGVDLIHRVLSGDLTEEVAPALGADIGQYLKAIDAALSGQTQGASAAGHAPKAAPAPGVSKAHPPVSPASSQSPSPSPSLSAAKGPPAAPKAESAAPKAEASKKDDGKRREFLHVPVDTVEHLIHLSGELTLWQTQQDRVVADVRRLAHDWRSTTQRLREEGRIDADVAEKLGALARELGARVQQMRDDGFQNALRLTELQDSVGGMQLVEVRTVFGKYPRAVRAMVRDLGKDCAVELEGVEVAVDKTVLMQIEDALLHLVRNSVDHGIEMPEVRAARGKPARGTLKLCARNKGSFVEVEISDDGGGIDAKKIAARLVSKGILSADATAAMSEDELLHQIFRPGFSTAETVTDISGRGVGMDVVKRQIDAMGGSVRIFTKVGEGTRFLLSLPVSASVAQAMVFRQDQGLYAMPSAMIDSMLHVMPSAVQRIGGQSLLRYEDELISLHDLAGVLGFPVRRVNEPFWRVVVVRAGDRRLALRVGTVLGERKLVVDTFKAGVMGRSADAAVLQADREQAIRMAQLLQQENATNKTGQSGAPEGTE